MVWTTSRTVAGRSSPVARRLRPASHRTPDTCTRRSRFFVPFTLATVATMAAGAVTAYAAAADTTVLVR